MGILKVPRILSWAGKVPTGYYAPTGIPCLGRRVTVSAAHKKKKKIVRLDGMINAEHVSRDGN